MRKRMNTVPMRVWLTALLVMLMLAGCVVPEALIVQPPDATQAPPLAPAPQDTTQDAPIDAPDAISPHLAAALAHAPITTQTFAFTDWSFLKRVAGVPNLTSADSLDDRLAFMKPLAIGEQAVTSGFGLRYFMTHAETWGWDSTDLVWETYLTLDGPPTWVLRFRDDFDFAPVLARLDEREYTTSIHEGVTVYSHELDLTEDWIRSSEFSVMNIAYMEAENSFILASAPEAVTGVLDLIALGATMVNQPAMRSVAAAMGEVGAAILAPDGCAMLDIAVLLGDSSNAIELLMREIEEAGITHAYNVFGFGYQVATLDNETLPVGVFVHHYDDAAHAEADLEPRRLVAATGESLARRVTYAELFEVMDASVVTDANGAGGANVVLRFHALAHAPQLFVNMIYQRDLLFSACGG